MSLLNKIKKGITSLVGGSENKTTSAASTDAASTAAASASPAKPAEPDYNPAGKPLEWFTSEIGLESFKKHVTPQNYMLEENYKVEYEKNFSKYSYVLYLNVCHKGETLPTVYFDALKGAINVQQLSLVGTAELFRDLLKILAKPFYINDDGEPEACPPQLPPEQLLSVDKNPLLNFVKNFNVFDIEDDELGTASDKYDIYIRVLFFLAKNVKEISIEENKWLFDKNTYLNDFGTVRKEKGFLKKCKEVSAYTEYFDEALAKLG